MTPSYRPIITADNSNIFNKRICLTAVVHPYGPIYIILSYVNIERRAGICVKKLHECKYKHCRIVLVFYGFNTATLICAVKHSNLNDGRTLTYAW